MAENVTIKLEHPVQLADRKLTEVSMRRMTVGDVIDHPVAGVNDMPGEVRLVAALCGLNPEDLRLLDFSDYAKVQAALVSFRGGL